MNPEPWLPCRPVLVKEVEEESGANARSNSGSACSFIHMHRGSTAHWRRQPLVHGERGLQLGHDHVDVRLAGARTELFARVRQGVCGGCVGGRGGEERGGGHVLLARPNASLESSNPSWPDPGNPGGITGVTSPGLW